MRPIAVLVCCATALAPAASAAAGPPGVTAPTPPTPAPADRAHLTIAVGIGSGASDTVAFEHGPATTGKLAFSGRITGGGGGIAFGLALDHEPGILGHSETRVGALIGSDFPIGGVFHGLVLGEIGLHDVDDLGAGFLLARTAGDASSELPYAGVRLALTVDTRSGFFVGGEFVARRDLGHDEGDVLVEGVCLFCTDGARRTESVHYRVGGSEALLVLRLGWKL